ncbi:MAG: hypothetical protein ACODAG_07740 [Myxococcota bacterium]
MPRIKTFQNGDTLEELDATWLDRMVDASHILRGSVTDTQTSISGWKDGGAHVLVLAMSLVRPSSGVATYVLDTSIDWRDRQVLFAATRFDGVVLHGAQTLHTTRRFMSTGPGKAEGDPENDWSLRFGSEPVWIAASDDDGALVVEIDESYSNEVSNVAVQLHATEQLGIHSSPPTRHTPNPTDGNDISPTDINAAQDGGLLRQAAQGRVGIDRARSSSYTPRPVVSVPLGPAVRGEPPLSISEAMYEKNGVVPPAAFVARQHVVGEERRTISVFIPAASSLVVDSSIDWRDRYVQYTLGYDVTDIRPGQSSDTDFDGSEKLIGQMFTGPGGNDPFSWWRRAMFSGLEMYADESTGELVIRNSSGAGARMAGMVTASFPLGLTK